MKKTPPNEYRVKNGPMPSTDDMGMLGIFRIPYWEIANGKVDSIGNAFNAKIESILNRSAQPMFTVVVNDDRYDKKWEHVSVSLQDRCPTWEEMCCIKSLFWEDDETVVQFHPKKSEYKNLHPYCLHMWRDTTKEHELPPSIYVAL